MNAINYALNNLKYTIPLQVLNLAFLESSDIVNKTLSLDEMIMSKLIRPRVLVDANVVGGVMLRVNLEDCRITSVSNREVIIDVPKTVTGGRAIMSALSLVSNFMIVSQLPNIGESPLISAGANMMNNLSTENIIQTARLEIIGENIILVQEPSTSLLPGILRCMVENSSNLENINPRSYPKFLKLCLLAVKSYIYNTLKIKMDQGFIYSGHELGAITEIIDTYADAEEQYQEYLAGTWKRVAFLNDNDSKNRLIKSMLGNTI
ncbi:MAG: hypothetical protein JHC33_13145 [Ignisphaera sp.]|nr:hypothetical protein [Ignisphaera sp.]